MPTLLLVYDTVRNSTLFVFNDVVLLWTRSSDDGVTWTSPRPVTIGNYSATRVAPGRGLQLRSTNPVAPGRILFVSQLSINEGDIVYYTVRPPHDSVLALYFRNAIAARKNERQQMLAHVAMQPSPAIPGTATLV